MAGPLIFFTRVRIEGTDTGVTKGKPLVCNCGAGGMLFASIENMEEVSLADAFSGYDLPEGVGTMGTHIGDRAGRGHYLAEPYPELLKQWQQWLADNTDQRLTFGTLN